jgi:predicted membrane protein
MSPKLENLSVLTAILNFLITILVFWNVTLYSQIGSSILEELGISTSILMMKPAHSPKYW